MKKRKKRKVLFVIFFLMLAAGGTASWIVYHRLYEPNVRLVDRVTDYIYIPTGAGFETVVDSVSAKVRNINTFSWVAERMSYTTAVKPGRYLIRHGMNNRELVTLLRSGRQSPVKVTFNNLRTLEQFAGRISAQLEADSVSLLKVFRDTVRQKAAGLNAYSGISILMPNTYEIYWNTNAENFYERMLKEYNAFWNNERLSKLEKTGLSKAEVSTLASIVEQETRKDDEKSVIAGVYLNRYHKGWKLEADPTLVYALGDFSIRRVLNVHKEVDSPYNTYRNKGLPPGPICIPGIASIDAVLNYAQHDYFYFCAKDDFSGYHAFAKTYSDHLLNAKRFHRALSKRGIMS